MKRTIAVLFTAAALSAPAMAQQPNPAPDQGTARMEKSLAPLQLTPTQERVFQRDLHKNGMKAWAKPKPGNFIG
ncbi:MAG: hypothetical protein ACLPPF_04935 [Rhodomicrobium sp.]